MNTQFTKHLGSIVLLKVKKWLADTPASFTPPSIKHTSLKDNLFAEHLQPQLCHTRILKAATKGLRKLAYEEKLRVRTFVWHLSAACPFLVGKYIPFSVKILRQFPHEINFKKTKDSATVEILRYERRRRMNRFG